jgi:hypothetical protein
MRHLAWLPDVFVLLEFQGQAPSKQPMQAAFCPPRALQACASFPGLATTLDAHGLWYCRFGFQDLPPLTGTQPGQPTSRCASTGSLKKSLRVVADFSSDFSLT